MDISDCSANQHSEELKVDILECGDSRVEFQEEEEVLCEASSSSFGDSMCASDDDLGFGPFEPFEPFGPFGDEEEAQSMLSKDYPLPETCDDVTEFLGSKKKKLTDEWRRFCHPLTWRCKWLELKVKEIESQAKGYEKEVKNHYESKQFDLEKSKLEGFEGKSIPFRDQTQRMSLFKRRGRNRVEETTDVAAYLSNHNLFSYAEKRKPTTHKAQYPDPDFGSGRKAMCKEDETEDDCLVSGLDCSDDFLAKILCKIDEAQERAKGLRKRVDQLMTESKTAHASLMPQTIARSQSDLTVQNGKQRALVEEPLMPQREATVQIGRQRISADHTEDLLIPQAPPPPIQTSGQCLNNNSPFSSGGLRFHTILEDLLMDEAETNDDETEADEEKLDYFMKLINEITGVPPSEEADEEEEDPTPVTKMRKTSH